MNSSYIYILTNRPNGVLYTGITSDLLRRVFTHKSRIVRGFSRKYNTEKLVYYEYFEDINYAIAREKELKKWRRAWKLNLIEKMNPTWRDLYFELLRS